MTGLLAERREPHSEASPPSNNEAIRFLGCLFHDQPYLVQIWTAFRAAGSTKLANPAERYYRADQLAEAAAWALEQDRMGREVYVCVHPLLGKKREKYNAAPVSNLWTDVDNGDLDRSPIKASLVVESSPGRRQAYCRTELMAPDKAEELSKRWAVAIGADGSGFDRTQLLRVAGTRNHKYTGWPEVRITHIDNDAKPYTVAQLEKLLPPLPRPTVAAEVTVVAVSEDAQEVLASVLERPGMARVWQGDIADYASPSEAEWALARELVRASGLNVDLAESIMRRCEGLDRDKWDHPRDGRSYLRYTLEHAAKKPFTEQNATPYRSDDPTTWPELEATVPDGPANGKCSDHCKLRHHPKEQALFRQIESINELIQCDLTPVFKLTLLRLVALIGYQQSRGNTRFQASAKKIGESIGLSAQSVRTVLHSLARYDMTKDPGETLNHERGLIDLDSTRVPEAGEFCRVFDITPLTEGGYAGFIEAVVAFAPELPAASRRSPRQKHEEVRPPADIVQIQDCPGPGGYHPMRSRPVVCGTCEDELIEEVRYTQNATPYRFEERPPLWSTSNDEPYRSELPALPDYWPVYDKVAAP